MIRSAFAVLLVALMGLPAVWYGPEHPWALIVVAAMLWPLAGVLRGSLRAAVWACLAALAPFLHGVAEAFSNPDARGLALLETGICVALWMLLTAWAAAHRRARLSAPRAPGARGGSSPPRDPA